MMKIAVIRKAVPAGTPAIAAMQFSSSPARIIMEEAGITVHITAVVIVNC
jgi:hypothetical protein